LKNYDCFKKEFARLFETLKPPKMHEFLSEKIEPPMIRRTSFIPSQKILEMMEV